MIQQAKTGLVSESSGRQSRPVFSWKLVIKDCLYFLALAIILGVLWNFSLLLKAFDGRLINEIQQYQLAELKSKAKQLYRLKNCMMIGSPFSLMPGLRKNMRANIFLAPSACQSERYYRET